MHLLTYLLTVPSVLAVVLPRQSTNSSGACAEINARWLSSGAQPGDSFTLRNGQVAQDCLNEIPFYFDLATGVLEELRKYIQFQSTLEALKNPPDTYKSPPIDIIGGLDDIADKASAKEYTSHYEFETDINNLLRSANDGHLFVAFCTYGFFQFSRPASDQIALVSINGTDIPELYLVSDIEIAGLDDVSSIATINAQDAFEYLTGFAANQSSQDPDARLNTLFPSYAAGATGNADLSVGAFLFNNGIWPGSNITVIEFKNGSTQDIPTRASLSLSSFANITNGQDMFEAYCLPSSGTSSSFSSATEPTESGTPTATEGPSSSSSVSPTFTAGPSGYPEPKFRDPYNQILGFDVDDSTAVMMIPTFEGGPQFPDNQSTVFSDTATKIVNDAVASGRTHLIIDISSNGGGNIDRAFNLFKLFFPSEFPYSATRFRRHESADLLAKVLGTLNKTAADNEGNFGYQGQVTPDQDSGFDSLQAFLGDKVQLGVNVSSLYANFNYTSNSNPTLPIHGYSTIPLNTTQPFLPSNILIIGDGNCQSTCTTFVNLMTNVGNVRTLALGGRPQPGPMQLMGGVRGGQSATFDRLLTIASDAMATLQNNNTPAHEILSPAEQRALNTSLPTPYAQWPVRVNAGQVNLRNAYQEGDDNLPLQFAYQAADCRLFYTHENLVRPETLWPAAVRAVWGGEGAACVEGSEGAEGSRGHRVVLGGGNGTGDANDGEEGEEESGSENAAAGLGSAGGAGAMGAVAWAAAAALWVLLV